MTLSEALDVNDIMALMQGVYSILPLPDSSGRMLCFIHSVRHTKDGYSSENLVRRGPFICSFSFIRRLRFSHSFFMRQVRAVWYLMEIMAREHGDFVWVLWEKDSSIWNYDRYLLSHIPYYYRSCWPIKMLPTHVCGGNRLTRRVIGPVLNATLNRDGRYRTVFHDADGDQLLDALSSSYGIPKKILPTAMGGGIDVAQWLPVWIAQRRAIEMEEI